MNKTLVIVFSVLTLITIGVGIMSFAMDEEPSVQTPMSTQPKSSMF